MGLGGWHCVCRRCARRLHLRCRWCWRCLLKALLLLLSICTGHLLGISLRRSRCRSLLLLLRLHLSVILG